MAFFSTFYSFKGGVGRTLALANVATLLATDHEEPCRVLVWDFDLAAPGLQNVFNCRWGKTRIGFIDFVHQYLTTGQIGNIAEYIYKTDIEGIDILPAGADRQYPQKLEDIKWRQIYREARGFHFIEAVKKQIQHLEARYDYVLVDSLTGYSDAGGICVRQIPDAVVFLFRLNEQNLDGIQNVYRALRQSEETKQALVPVIPVISPAWPFASLEANAWIPRAQGIFPESQILEISFEGALTLGEQVISVKKDEFAITPKIIQEYDLLSRTLRDRNPQDLKTRFKEIPSLRNSGQYKEAAEHVLAILEQQPERPAYWDELVSTFSIWPKKLVELKEKALLFIDQQMVLRNPLAFVASARLHQEPGSWKECIKLLTEAIEIDPKLAQAYRERASIVEAKNMLLQAIDDYTKLLELSEHKLIYAYMQRGKCYFRRFSYQSAVDDFTSVLKARPRDVAALVYRPRCLIWLGYYEAAIQDLDKLLTLDESNEIGHLLKAYAFLLNSQIDKAIVELNIVSTIESYSPLNIAEAYLAIDPIKTISLLGCSDGRSGKKQEPISIFLLAFATQLIGDEEESARLLNILAEHKKQHTWNFFEARLLIDVFVKRGQMKESSASLLRAAIDKMAEWSTSEEQQVTEKLESENQFKTLFKSG